jgi:hypothetical protein
VNSTSEGQCANVRHQKPKQGNVWNALLIQTILCPEVALLLLRNGQYMIHSSGSYKPEPIIILSIIQSACAVDKPNFYPLFVDPVETRSIYDRTVDSVDYISAVLPLFCEVPHIVGVMLLPTPVIIRVGMRFSHRSL